MDSSQIPTLAVGLLALVASVVMAWRAASRQGEVPDPDKPRQYRRFTRRRFVMSGLVGLVGIALIVGALIPRAWCEKHPLDITILWLGVIAVLVVLLALCVADIYAVLRDQISAHYRSDHWTAPDAKPGPKGKPRG